uniref:acetyl-coenzyme A transporter 1-like n=1 Tax=Styela clava TaxID=7725 RepID=UPI00193A932E|nr:acetyl-coenzyme A transporter 1-like [Styela clava]XP_039263178.1 acetyl-coenzyme A transporter 1-like [Styela clava]
MSSRQRTGGSNMSPGNHVQLQYEYNTDDDTVTYEDKKPPYNSRGWWYEDRSSVLLLLFLYVLQGLPLGLAGSIPMILAGKNVDYHQQALFSFVFWPFSIKLLWAPIVDGAYVRRFGRRKTWLVPTQYAIGIVMYILSLNMDKVLETKNPNIWALTISFFILNFCAATQDIAVDGWALTMLSKKNVGLASTCNSVGQTAGYFLGYVVYMALESKDFCNKFLRSVPEETGIITLSGFMCFWSIVFIFSTTFVMIFKNEKSEEEKSLHHDEDHTEHTGVIDTYKLLWKIAWLPAVFQYVIILLTCKIGYASEAAVGLKLIAAGVHKESLALLAIPMTPLQILLPLLIAKYTAGPKPLDLFIKAIPFRLLFTVFFAVIVYWTPYLKQEDGTYSYTYFTFILLIYAAHQIALYSMFVSTMSFNAKISDPKIGGTYMTLLNTVSNLGGNWPSTTALWFVDNLTWNYCEGGTSNIEFCTTATKEQCESLGGSCITHIDGYYIEAFICLILGLIWLWWKRNSVEKLQHLSSVHWKCPP